MKVLQIVNAFPSIENTQYGIFNKLQIESLIKKGVLCEVFRIDGKKGKVSYANAVFELRKMYNLNEFDLIHAHYSFSAFPALFQFKRPLVISFMGSDVNGQYGAMFFKIFKFINIIYCNIVSFKASAVICKSKKMFNNLRLISNKSFVIPNGVDFEIFKPKDKIKCREVAGINKNDFIVCFAANPKKAVKNYTLAQKAVDYASNTLGKTIKILPVFNKNHNKYINLLNACDLLILTSLSEGSPNIVKEAIACNKPVVSVDVGDVREHLNDVKNSYVTSYDYRHIGSRICDVLLSDMQSNGREKIYYLKNDVIAEQIISIYERIIIDRKQCY